MPETDSAACCSRIEHAVELVMRQHLPVRPDENGPVLCICDVTQTYEGPVHQRQHVAVELRKAGLLRG